MKFGGRTLILFLGFILYSYHAIAGLHTDLVETSEEIGSYNRGLMNGVKKRTDGINGLNVQINEMDFQIEAHSQEVWRVKAQEEHITYGIQEKGNESSHLRGEVDSVLQSLETTSNNVDHLTEQKIQLTNTKQSIEQNILTLDQNIAAQNRSMDYATQMYQNSWQDPEAMAYWQSQVEMSAQQIQGLSQQRVQLEAMNTQVEGSITQVDQQIGVLNERAAELAQRRAVTLAEIERTEAERRQLEQALVEANNDRERLEAERARVEEERVQAEANKAALETEKNQMSETLAQTKEAEEQIKQAEEQIFQASSEGPTSSEYDSGKKPYVPPVQGGGETAMDDYGAETDSGNGGESGDENIAANDEQNNSLQNLEAQAEKKKELSSENRNVASLPGDIQNADLVKLRKTLDKNDKKYEAPLDRPIQEALSKMGEGGFFGLLGSRLASRKNGQDLFKYKNQRGLAGTNNDGMSERALKKKLASLLAKKGVSRRGLASLDNNSQFLNSKISIFHAVCVNYKVYEAKNKINFGKTTCPHP